MARLGQDMRGEEDEEGTTVEGVLEMGMGGMSLVEGMSLVLGSRMMHSWCGVGPPLSDTMSRDSRNLCDGRCIRRKALRW